MFSFNNKIITLFVLASFAMVAFFGLAMVHGVDGSMTDDCPLSTASAVLCPLNALNTAVNHISAYRDFFNILISYGVIVAVLSVCSRFIIPIPVLGLFYGLVPYPVTYDRTAITWLSLLEHSPSL